MDRIGHWRWNCAPLKLKRCGATRLLRRESQNGIAQLGLCLEQMIGSRLRCCALLVSLLASFGTQSRAFQEADPGKGNADPIPASTVIEQLASSVVFSSDGTSQTEERAKIRIQSDADVKQYGVLTIPFLGGSERVEISIRVTKPSGTIVETPDSDIQDLPTAVTRAAPTYSDSREKQVPVKGLGVGDLLEFHTRNTRTVAEIPGQFWFMYNFNKAAIVHEETLSATVPEGKYVKLSSPGLAPEVTRANGQVTYSWKSSTAQVPKRSEKQIPRRLQPSPEIQITSFRTWEEVGQWYSSVAKPKIQVTPEIQAQAQQLTAGLATEVEKERAIY